MTPDDVYLDHAASSPLRPEAVAAMTPWMEGWAANASGAHRRARAARAAVEDARDVMAEVLGVGRNEIVFTSGGTEADDLAVNGTLGRRRGTAVCSSIEHPAVLEPIGQNGGRVVGVDRDGVVDLDALASALGPETALVSVMAVNNEVGTVQPIAAVADIVAEHAPHAALHTDAVQAFSHTDLREISPRVELLSLSSHKFGGPTGVGLCVISHGIEVEPRQRGGGQEQERRGGTLDVAGIVGMAAAAAVTDERREGESLRIRVLRDRFLEELCAAVPQAVPTTGRGGSPAAPVVAGTAHVCFEGHDSEELLFLLDEAGVCASAASACASGATRRSHVLSAMGVPEESARGAVRFTFGHDTSDEDVRRALAAITDACSRLSSARRSGVGS